VKFDTIIYRTKGLLDLVHMDVWGLIKITSLGGPQYFVSFVEISLGIAGEKKIWSPKFVYEVEEIDREIDWQENQSAPIWLCWEVQKESVPAIWPE